jgi:DNA-binding transcriptional regulator YiaG
MKRSLRNENVSSETDMRDATFRDTISDCSFAATGDPRSFRYLIGDPYGFFALLNMVHTPTNRLTLHAWNSNSGIAHARFRGTIYPKAMRNNEKRPNAPSAKAVIELRNALKLTQQRFAGEVMKTAITTIARWETGNPAPRGDALLKLADVAWAAGQINLSDAFTMMYLEEIVPLVRMAKVRRINWPSGFVFCRFDTAEDAERAILFLRRSADDIELAKAENK